MRDLLDDLRYQVKYGALVKGLTKEPKYAEILIDFAQHEDFVDLFDMVNTPKYENTNYGANELKATLEMINQTFPGLVEFKKKGWRGLQICWAPKPDRLWRYTTVEPAITGYHIQVVTVKEKSAYNPEYFLKNFTDNHL